ncbi:hypothetical protein PVAP13_1KG507200 [Panicum virgatum]|uniref:Kinesin motor domain-containing protein n=1 Tax=Panicum virgatum TaxID=38727 RepID=A0A8T0XTC9_PANVG|nr:hypothetical protein PVAP13_1KG507200 [Panicum virgatum]
MSQSVANPARSAGSRVPMENQEAAVAQQPKDSVKVAVNVRPLITAELQDGCTDCVTITPSEPQVQIGPHVFTFDHVYGNSGPPSSLIFEQCVHPLIDALFSGYNATVLAYGQTGSGKTYTMGTDYSGEGNCGGIIPQVMETIFRKVDASKDGSEFLIRVSFIEIFKEEVFDLLDSNHAAVRLDSVSVPKSSAPARVPIQIRETATGGITLAGVTEAEVKSKEEMASYLIHGSSSRATASTNMNRQSSRSHAIFTICVEQKRASGTSDKSSSSDYDILSSKFHLVDLAGSERAKRTGADGHRLKEGIHINKGLLALGNVISALGDEKKRKEGAFVPYRDSKLTRLLQDSLGGNSKTVMIACISPADINAEETINTLKYANRARNIQNKAVVNRDPATAEMQKLRSQLEQLQTELLFSRSGSAALEELQLLQKKVSLLELKNSELNHELKERELSCEQLAERARAAQLERDQLMLKIEAARNGKSWDALENAGFDQDVDLMKSYISKIQQLESDLMRQNFSSACRHGLHDQLAMERDILLHDLGSECEVGTPDVSSEVDEEKEREHSSMQDQLDKELQELDKRLQQKEAEMKQFGKSDTSVLKQHYEKKLNELEQEKKALQKEIENLRHALTNISSSTDESAQKLKENYLQKLNALESQVSELKKKQEAQQQLLRQKQRSDEAAKRLQEDIQRIKSQKVQLQQKIKQESEQFRAWKAAREKEVLQLKKEGRRNEYEMHKLLALNQRQKMVLQRKTEEAAAATRRLKELLEAKKSSRETYGGGNGSGMQAVMRAIDDELEVNVRAHELRSYYERQKQERAAISKEIAKLKEESKHKMRCQVQDKEVVCNEKEHIISELKEKVVVLNSGIRQLEMQVEDLGHQNMQLFTALNNAKKAANYSRNDSCISEDSQTFALRKSVRPSPYFGYSKNDWLDDNDMDTSDSDYSGELENMSEESDADWVQSTRKVRKHRRTLSSHINPNLGYPNTQESAKPEKLTDEKCILPNVVPSDGCSCSKSSSCKTNKCECRGSGAQCGAGCGCKDIKCSNRNSSSDNPEIVNQGIMLLKNAFSEKDNQDAEPRKALADIGNNVVNQTAETKKKPRKNWRKSTIQLVPAPLPPSATEATEAATRDRVDIPLKLPRAMSSGPAESNPPPLTDRNAAKRGESVSTGSKESTAATRPPSQLRKNATTEKENQLR